MNNTKPRSNTLFLSSWHKLVCLTGFCLLSILCGWQQAHAGSQQNANIQHAPEKIADFSKGIERYAAAQGARAFIIARVGRPVKDLPKGIFYTHTAVAIYSAIQLSNGDTVNGYAIHNLYQQPDDKGRSQLVTDYPVDFFWGAYELKAGLIIPTPEVQQSLVNLVSTNKHLKLHNPKYSVLANPFNNDYQNCTEFTLDMLNASIYSTLEIPQLKANAKAHFMPQRIRTNRFKLFLGAALMDDITTQDHSGRVHTATFTSIARYLQKYGLAKQVVMIKEDLLPTPI